MGIKIFQVNYIVFISRLTETDANNLKPNANKLSARGRLTLILLGDGADPLQEQSKKLTDNIIVWKDPTTTQTPDNWNDKMWSIAYGCGKSLNFA